MMFASRARRVYILERLRFPVQLGNRAAVPGGGICAKKLCYFVFGRVMADGRRRNPSSHQKLAHTGRYYISPVRRFRLYVWLSPC